jgi:hypothetical protein
MGFKKSWDSNHIISELRSAAVNAASSYNDGWTAMMCKHDLYQVKCWLDDVYPTLPKFSGEEKWEQERVISILKK